MWKARGPWLATQRHGCTDPGGIGGAHIVYSEASSGRPAKSPARSRRSGAKALARLVGRHLTAQLPCQKGQKGRKGAQRHDGDPLSDLSDLSGSGAPEKSSGLTCHRWIGRPSVFVVTSFSQPARTKPSSRVRVCSASS